MEKPLDTGSQGVAGQEKWGTSTTADMGRSIGWVSLAMINLAIIYSVRGLPLMAEEEFCAITFMAISGAFFLIPISLVTPDYHGSDRYFRIQLDLRRQRFPDSFLSGFYHSGFHPHGQLCVLSRGPGHRLRDRGLCSPCIRGQKPQTLFSKGHFPFCFCLHHRHRDVRSQKKTFVALHVFLGRAWEQAQVLNRYLIPHLLHECEGSDP